MSSTTRPELTPQQRDAVHAAEPKIVVRASAGAGKTSVLVARYLRHVIDDGMRPDEILTVTFTRKAAAEMKGRIVAELLAKGLRAEAQAAETGPIQTLHGFCERLLRECSVAAGIDPEFRILHEVDAARMRSEAVEAAISSERSPWCEKLIASLAGKRGYGGASTHAKLRSAVDAVLDRLRGSGIGLGRVVELHQSPEALLAEARSQIVAELEPPVREAFDQSDSTLPFAARIRRAYKAVKAKPPRSYPSEASAEDADGFDRMSAEESCGLVAIATNAWGRLEAALREANALDFVALEARALQVLESSEDARARIRSQLRAVLVDESQDLNPIQYRLLEALGIEVETFVGDAQQSIYGFRKADVRLFHRKASNLPTKLLSQNFRSREGILRFVDGVFARHWGSAYAPMLDEPFDPDSPPRSMDGVELWVQDAQDSGQIAAWIAELLEEGANAGDVAVLVRKSAYAQSLESKLEALGVPARIVGGSERFYARLEIRDLANVLAALVDPDDDLAHLAMLRGPACGLSIDSLILLGSQPPVSRAMRAFQPPDPPDAAALARLLEWFAPLSEFAGRLPAWEVVSEVLNRSSLFEDLASRPDYRRTIANTRKLLRMAAARPELNAREFAESIREIQELRHREGDAPTFDEDADTVTILTIHKAKGLEFPIVVVPDLHGRIVRQASEVEIDPWTGIVSAKFGHDAGLLHAWIAEKRKLQETEEAFRVLYVALTRAKERLCVAIAPGGRTSLASTLAELAGFKDVAPPGLKVRSGELVPDRR